MMIFNYLKISILLCWYITSARADNICECAKVPYDFCEGTFYQKFFYNTNLTIHDSQLKSASYFSNLAGIDEIRKQCDHDMLNVEAKRTIERTAEELIVAYYLIAEVKTIYRYNYTLLSDDLKAKVTCMTGNFPPSVTVNSFKLNISGTIIPAAYSQSDHVSPEICHADVIKKCPNGANETANHECVISPGWYCNINQTKPIPCPVDTYQEKSRKCTCESCPAGTTTRNETASASSLFCLKECSPGQYLNATLNICVSCPKDTYQNEKNNLICKVCPTGTTTREQKGSTESSSCIKVCSQGQYFNTTYKGCAPCPKNTFQNETGKFTCKRCPKETTTNGDVGSANASSCVITTTKKPVGKENNTSKIVIPIVAGIVILVLGYILWTVHKKRSIRQSFLRNFPRDNPYYEENTNADEEQHIERCDTLGALACDVEAKNLEIPRESLKLTGKTLGRGHFGEVHQALLKKNGENELLCAVKQTRGANISIKDMLDELGIHLKIDKNLNVVNLLGVCSSSDGPFYLVVEYCDNGSLSDFLRAHQGVSHYVNTSDVQPLTQEWRFQRTLEICNGMKYLSCQKIIHRDLAARNVLLDQNMVAKVSDFGMAKDVYVKSYYTSEGGTFPLRWMAIEAIDSLSFTEKTDVWSYGVVVWEIFNEGRFPYYEIINDQKVAQYILNGKKLKRPPLCPKRLYNTLLTCWKNKPYNRLTFKQLYEHLKTWIESEEREEPATSSTPYLKRRFKETRRSLTKKLPRRHSSRKTSAEDMREPLDTPYDTRSNENIDGISGVSEDEIKDKKGMKNLKEVLKKKKPAPLPHDAGVASENNVGIENIVNDERLAGNDNELQDLGGKSCEEKETSENVNKTLSSELNDDVNEINEEQQIQKEGSNTSEEFPSNIKEKGQKNNNSDKGCLNKTSPHEKELFELQEMNNKEDVDDTVSHHEIDKEQSNDRLNEDSPNEERAELQETNSAEDIISRDEHSKDCLEDEENEKQLSDNQNNDAVILLSGNKQAVEGTRSEKRRFNLESDQELDSNESDTTI